MAPRITGNISLTGPAPVPAKVSKLQAVLALHMSGNLQAVEAAVAADGPGTQLYWATVSEIHRNHIVVAGIAYALGWTSEQLDQMFRDAAQIT